MKLFYLKDQNRLVRSLSDASAPDAFSFKQGDTEQLVIQQVEALATEAADGSIFRAVPTPTTGIKAWIGGIEEAPTTGTVKFRVVGETETTAAFNYATGTRADLQTALNALAKVTELGGLTVEGAGTANADITGANYFVARWNDAACTARLEAVENKLRPLCAIERDADFTSDDPSQYILFYQVPPVFADQFANLTPAAVTCTRSREGGVLQNEVQLVTIPADSRAIYALRIPGSAATSPISASATAATVAAALNALWPDSQTRYTVKLARRGVLQIEFVGPLAAASQAVLLVEMIENPVTDYAVGLLRFKGYALRMAMRGEKTRAFIFELEITAGDDDTKTPIQVACTVINDAIPFGVATDLAQAGYVRTETVLVYPAETDPAVIALLGQPFNVPDEATEIAATDFIFTHNFGTEQVDVTILRRSSVDPEKWEKMGEGEFAWEAIDANAVEILFATAPASSGLGSVRVWIHTLNAQPILNNHRHTADQIDGTGAEAGKALNVIIAELRAALPTGWPAIPANKIDGKLAPSQIDLDALALALKTNGPFLDALRVLVGDSGVLDAIASGLASRTAFLDTIKTALANADVLAGLAAALGTSADFRATIADLVGAALQGGSLPEGSTIFEIAPVDETFPQPFSATPSDPLDFAELLPAVHDPLSNTIEGALPTGGADTDYIYTVGAAGATTRGGSGRRGATFAEGTVLGFTGARWFPVVSRGDSAWPVEMERTLGIVHIGDGMLASGSRFALDLALQLQLRGTVAGSALLRLLLGTVAEFSPGVPPNISAVVWNEETPILAQQIILTPSVLHCRFGYALTRNGDTLTATTTKFSTTTASDVIPGSPVFAIKADLVNFDIEDSPLTARGALSLKLLKPACSIITL